jgi:hypothetical protein
VLSFTKLAFTVTETILSAWAWELIEQKNTTIKEKKKEMTLFKINYLKNFRTTVLFTTVTTEL